MYEALSPSCIFRPAAIAVAESRRRASGHTGSMHQRAWQDRPRVGATHRPGRDRQPAPISASQHAETVRLRCQRDRGAWDGSGTILHYDQSSVIVCALHVASDVWAPREGGLGSYDTTADSSAIMCLPAAHLGGAIFTAALSCVPVQPGKRACAQATGIRRSGISRRLPPHCLRGPCASAQQTR